VASNILGVVFNHFPLNDDGLDFGSGDDRRRPSHRFDGMRQIENLLGRCGSDTLLDSCVVTHVLTA